MDALLTSGAPGAAARELGASRRNRLNGTLLFGGYAAGQGAIFAVQTLLVAHDQLPLLAAFGSAFSFAILGSLVIDFGALTVLARETAHANGDAKRIWTSYWSVTAWRLAIGVGVAVAAASFCILTADGFLRAYALWALPAALLWPFNATGVLDGLRRSGVSGVTGSVPYLCSALALLVAMRVSPGEGGALLGGALTVGYALTLLGQYAALRLTGHMPRFVRPAVAQLLTIGREAGAVLLTNLPGQLYFRYQLFLANLVLGPAGTALFLYAKQIATAFAQVVGFMRRVEFPDLVAHLAEVRGDLAKVALRTQLTGTLVGAAGATGILAGGVAGYLWLPGALSEAALATAFFAPVVFAGALATAAVQGLQAVRRYGIAAIAMASAVAVGAGINAMAIVWPTLVAFVAADLAVYAIAAAISWMAFTGARTAAKRGTP